MTRVVADTNVFISSFFGGNPRKVIDLWKSGEITLCLSKAILDEYIEVLRRLELQNENELEELLGLFALGFHLVYTAKTPRLHVVEEDPDISLQPAINRCGLISRLPESNLSEISIICRH